MADIPVVSSSQQCKERQALIDQIRNAISLTTSIHNAELEHTIGGTPRTTEWYAQRLREAHENRALLIEQLGHHIAEHGCWRNPAAQI